MNLLVCLEGSASTASAIELAIGLARCLAASLVGLAIVDEPDIVAGQPTSIGGASFKRERDAVLLEDAHARAQDWLDSFAHRARAADVPVRTLALAGYPAALIVEQIRRHDLTLFGRDVNFRFETQDRDRNTRDRILRRAGKPIIVVPANPDPAGPSVMIAYDGSPAATRALRSFAASGLARGQAIHVSAVQDDGALAFEIAARGCELLDREFGIRAEPDNIVSPSTTTVALLARRQQLAAGLIVLGGYVPSPLARLVWGSVTHGIVEHTVVPVYLHY
jgi:nucleotide-binding universal stress UspA family protein